MCIHIKQYKQGYITDYFPHAAGPKNKKTSWGELCQSQFKLQCFVKFHLNFYFPWGALALAMIWRQNEKEFN